MIHPKPQEIRTGNYFKILTGTYVEITSVDRVGLIEYMEFGNPIEEYEDSTTALFPIELTEEWIVRFGCSNIKGHNCWFINYFGFCLTHDGEDWCLKPRADEPYLICYIKYVHEFQNICFALSREELTLTN